MAHPYVNDPVVSELDDIAQELEKTGNADLATLVDEVSAELMTSQRRTVAGKKKTEKKDEKPSAKSRAKKNKKSAPAKKEADTNFGSRRARIASAMRKIARAQVAELEDIAAELLKEGEKKAALEVLKIAEDLDSDYDYSAEGKHSAPSSKGDASKLYDREKANKPDAKMDAEEKEDLELPFGDKGEGYPKQSAFDKQLDSLIRLAMEEELGEEPAMDFGGEDSEDADEELDMSEESEDGMEEDEESEDSEDSEDSEEDADDMDLGGLGEEESEEGGEDADDMDLGGLDLGDGDDELASMMEAMDAEPEDMDASSDRMYEAEEGDEGSEEEPLFPPAAGEEEEEEGSEELGMEMDEDSDTEAMDLLPNLEVSGPLGTGFKFSSSDKVKMANLAKKLLAKGEKGLASRVAKLAKK